MSIYFSSILHHKPPAQSDAKPSVQWKNLPSSLPSLSPVKDDELLTRKEQRAHRRGKPSKWTWPAIVLMAIGGLAQTGVQLTETLFEEKVVEVQADLDEMNPVTAKYMDAGAIAYTLLAAAEIGEKKPLVGYALRGYVTLHKDDWVEKMPAQFRKSLKPLLEAYLDGKSSKDIQKMVGDVGKAQAKQIGNELSKMSESDAQLLVGGMAAQALLMVARLGEDVPAIGKALREYVGDNQDEWLKRIPEQAQSQVKPILDAYIRGAERNVLEALITDKATYSLARPTDLDSLKGNYLKKNPQLKALQKLLKTNGHDGFLELEGSPETKIHFWYFPAKPGMQTLLISNGRGATLAATANLILEAQKRGYGVMLYEYPQNGDSTGDLSQDGYFLATRMSLAYLLNEQALTLKQIINVGYSMGTNLAVRLSEKPLNLTNIPIRVSNDELTSDQVRALLHNKKSAFANTHAPLFNQDVSKVDVNQTALLSPPEGFGTVYDDVKNRHKNTLAAKMAVSSDLLNTFNTLDVLDNIEGKSFLFFYGEKDDYVRPWQTIHLAQAAESSNAVRIIGVPGQTHSSIRQDVKSVDQILDAIAQAYPSENTPKDKQQQALKPEKPLNGLRGFDVFHNDGNAPASEQNKLPKVQVSPSSSP